MRYSSRRPGGRLRGLVDLLWHIDDLQPAANPDPICPDGRTEIVLHLGAPMAQHVDGRPCVQPRHLLVGQMTGPVVIAPTGPTLMLGARLAPGALHRLLPIGQDQLAATILDLAAVWNQWTRRAADAAAAASTPGGRLDAVEAALEQLAPAAPPTAGENAIAAAAAQLDASGGNTPIEALARAAGLSRRQFERRFREQIGLSPRLFGRIVRFRTAFHALGSAPAAEIAARCGYADQAHLAHEVRRFAGRTPRVLAQADGLTRLFGG